MYFLLLRAGFLSSRVHRWGLGASITRLDRLHRGLNLLDDDSLFLGKDIATSLTVIHQEETFLVDLLFLLLVSIEKVKES